jgi:hypothetical protein
MNARAVARGVLVGATLAGVATIAAASLTVFDFWWYLASGERILATGTVPATDPFSYTAEGRPWINHMWATQVLFALLWAHGGRLALVALKTALVVATFAVVLRTTHARGVHPLPAAAMTLLAAWAGAEFWHARPQTITYLFVAVFLWLFRAGWEARRAPVLLVPALTLLWVNLHAGFVLAFALMGLVGVGTAVPLLADPARRRAGLGILGRTAALGGLGFAASLVNPFGVRALLFPFEVVGSVPFMTSTVEWFPPSFHHAAFRPLELLLLLLFPALAWGRARLRLADVALLFVFAHLALTAVRHVPLFAIVAAPILADALQGAWGRVRPPAGPAAIGALRRALPSLGARLAAPAAPLLAGAALVLLGVGVYWSAVGPQPGNPLRLDLDERRYPERTMAFIKTHRLPPPLFSVYAWGGYELWRLHPEYRMFLDGRTHVYGPEILQNYLQVVQAGPRWQAVLDRWGVQTILALRPSPLAEMLVAAGGWRLVHTEREAAVFVRESEANRALLARLGPLSRDAPIPGPPAGAAARPAGWAPGPGAAAGGAR